MFHYVRSRLASTSARELLRDTLLYIVAKAVPGLIGLISVVVFVRLLGVEQFGLFSLLGSTAMMWSTFSSSWMTQGILRHCTAPEAFDHPLWRQLLRGAGFAVALGSLGVILNLCLLDPKPDWISAILTWLLVVVTVLQTLAVTLWQAKLQPPKVLVLELVRTVAGFAICLVLVVAISATPAALLLGTSLGYALGIRWPAPAGAGTASATTVRLGTLWHYGWPLSIWLGIQTAFPWLDRLAISLTLGLEATGTFASLSDIVTRSFSLLIFPLTLAVHPRITARWNEGHPDAAQHLLRFAAWVSLLACILLVGAYYLGRFHLVEWLLPPAQRDTGMAAVPWLALAGAIWQIALLAHKPLELRSQTRIMLVCVLFSLGVKLALNWFAIPVWGLRGAAGATFAAGLTYCSACALYYRYLSARSIHA